MTYPHPTFPLISCPLHKHHTHPPRIPIRTNLWRLGAPGKTIPLPRPPVHHRPPRTTSTQTPPSPATPRPNLVYTNFLSAPLYPSTSFNFCLVSHQDFTNHTIPTVTKPVRNPLTNPLIFHPYLCHQNCNHSQHVMRLTFPP